MHLHCAAASSAVLCSKLADVVTNPNDPEKPTNTMDKGTNACSWQLGPLYQRKQVITVISAIPAVIGRLGASAADVVLQVV